MKDEFKNVVFICERSDNGQCCIFDDCNKFYECIGKGDNDEQQRRSN
jgi:hypothetical protein